jgi:hypothetical protein
MTCVLVPNRVFLRWLAYGRLEKPTRCNELFILIWLKVLL